MRVRDVEDIRCVAIRKSFCEKVIYVKKKLFLVFSFFIFVATVMKDMLKIRGSRMSIP